MIEYIINSKIKSSYLIHNTNSNSCLSFASQRGWKFCQPLGLTLVSLEPNKYTQISQVNDRIFRGPKPRTKEDLEQLKKDYKIDKIICLSPLNNDLIDNQSPPELLSNGLLLQKTIIPDLNLINKIKFKNNLEDIDITEYIMLKTILNYIKSTKENFYICCTFGCHNTGGLIAAHRICNERRTLAESFADYQKALVGMNLPATQNNADFLLKLFPVEFNYENRLYNIQNNI